MQAETKTSVMDQTTINNKFCPGEFWEEWEESLSDLKLCETFVDSIEKAPPNM